MKKLIYMLMVLILMLGCVAIVACGGGDDDDDGNGNGNGNGEEATSEATGAATAEATAEATEETSEPTSESTSGDGMMGQFGNLDDLKSYRMHMESTTEAPSMTGEGMETIDIVMDMAVVNDPPPTKTHMVMPDPSGMGMGDMEVITIGNTSWIKMGGDSWMESTVPETDTETSENITDYLDMDSDMDYLGKEKVNGVNCKHYKVDADIDVDIADAPGGVGELASHYKGEVWIADEGGLPEVMIRSKGTTEMETMGETMVSVDQIDITNINSSIDISPPPADQISDMPDFGDMMGDIEGMEDFDMEDLEGMFEGLEGMEGMDLESMIPPQ